MEAPQWVNTIVQLTTAGGFGALVWYLVVRHIPAIELRHKDERIAMMLQIAEMEEAGRLERKEKDARLEALLKEYHDKVEEHIAVMAEVLQVLNNVKSELQRNHRNTS